MTSASDSQPLKRGASGDRDPERLAASVVGEIARQAATPMPPGLYLVATPIGNLGDITLRALTVLVRADIVYCEDTRHSAKLLNYFAIKAVTRPLHDHNEAAEAERVLKDLASGKCIALVSDAGTPLISDPGFKLVRACRDAGHDVFPIPGASSLLASLSASGLPTDAFSFAGFLPPKTAARRTRLAELKVQPGTLVFFEAPQRVAASLADMADVLGPRLAVVARELTKLHEAFDRGALPDLAQSYAERDVKGEVVILVGPALHEEATDEAVAEHLRRSLATMSLKDAAKSASDALDIPRARAYALGLKIKDSDV